MVYETFQEGNWKFQRVGLNFYKVYYNAAGVNYVAMTGSDVSKLFTVPFFHRWVRISFFHTDSSNAASGNSWNITMFKEQSVSMPTKFEEYLYGDEKIKKARVTERFGEGFEYEAGTYKLTLNGTSTRRIYPQFTLQKLEAT